MYKNKNNPKQNIKTSILSKVEAKETYITR